MPPAWPFRAAGPQHSLNASTAVEYSSSNEVGLYLNGANGAPIVRRLLAGSLLDGAAHAVRVRLAGDALSIYVDNDPTASLIVPNLVDRLGDSTFAGADGTSWVGFTASTGVASMDADLLDFSFCARPECATR